MKHATNKQTSSSWIVLIFVLLLMNFNTGLAAKPDCNVNPSHPSCNDGGGAALDAYTLNDGSCAAAEAELFGDTRDLGGGGTGYQHCQNTMAGSNVPNNTKSLFTDFQRCILGMTLSGVG